MPSATRILAPCLLLAASAAASTAPRAATLPERYAEAWYAENGLLDVERAAELYQSIVAAPRAEPELAARALLRLAACYRTLGQDAAAGRAELEARRRYPQAIKRFPTYRLGVLHRQLDEAFGVGGGARAGAAIERFLEGLDVATVHSICESCYDQAAALRTRRPLDSVPVLRKAIAISTYLRQLERAAFAQKDIGDIYAAAGRSREAIAAYRKVQEAFPTCRSVAAWAAMSLAELHRLEGRLAEAVEVYRTIESDYPGQLPQVLWASLWMGDAFRAAGKMADARAAWRHVLEELNEPDYADQMAIAARLLGQSALEPPRIPQDEFANDMVYFLAVWHQMEGRWTEAVEQYDRCIKLSRGHDWPRALAVRARKSARRAATRSTDREETEKE
jgi:tetratricopeptide (TPR) repeat protein